MTREEAQKELAELEPREVEVWDKITRSTELRDLDIKRHEDSIRDIRMATDELLRRHNAEWIPLYDRKRQLKTFLELTQ